jgi:hypothetical protein
MRHRTNNMDVLRCTVRRALDEVRSGAMDPGLNDRLYTLTAELHSTLVNHPDVSSDFEQLMRELTRFKQFLNA